MGCVGNDEYGHLLEEIATKKINHPYILSLDNRHTSEAIVTLIDGERTFKFNRSSGADYVLDINELKKIDLVLKEIKNYNLNLYILSIIF